MTAVPMWESKTLTVKMRVEVDGHVLSFDYTVGVKGGRWNGEDPRQHGYADTETFEHSVRAGFAKASSECSQELAQLLHRMYPVNSGGGA